MAEIRSLEISINTNADKAARGIDKLKKSLEGLSDAKDNLRLGSIANEITLFGEAIEGSVDGIERLADSLDKLKGVKNLTSLMRQAASASKEVKQATTDVAGGFTEAAVACQNINNATKQLSIEAFNKPKNAVMQLGYEFKRTEKYAESLQQRITAVARAMQALQWKKLIQEQMSQGSSQQQLGYNDFFGGNSNYGNLGYENLRGMIVPYQGAFEMMAQSSKEFTQNVIDAEFVVRELPEDLDSVASSMRNITDREREMLQNMSVREMAESIKVIQINADKTKKPVSELIKRFKRLATAMAMRWAIRSTIKAISEGITAFHDYAKAMGVLDETGARVVDKLTLIGKTLQFNLGQLAVQVLNALYPLIEVIAKLLNSIIVGLGKLIAFANGNTWVDATDDVVKYTDALKNAKNTLLGFDEINKLNDNSSSSNLDASVNLGDTLNEENFTKLKELGTTIASLFTPKDGDDDNNNIIGKFKKLWATMAQVSVATLGLADVIRKQSEEEDNAEESADDLADALGDLGMAYSNCADALAEYITQLELYNKVTTPETQESNKETSKSFDTIPEAAVEAVNGLKFKMQPVMSSVMEQIQKDTKDNLWQADSSFAQATNDMGSAAQNLANGVPQTMSQVATSIANSSEKGAYEADKSYAQHFENIQNDAKILDSSLKTGRLNGSFGVKALSQLAIGAGLTFYGMIKKFIPVLRYSGKFAFASGGFPDAGQLFMARESGPELVGTMGNRNAVANNMQIIEGIKQGVMEAMQSSNISPTIEFTYKVDSETLYKTVKKGERSYNGRYVVGV